MVSILLFTGCKGAKDNSESKKANSKIEFEITSYDFGKIAFGSDGTCVFKFKNDSKNSLVINVVRTSCGCTNPEWPKDPLEYGNSGEIKITYNTKIIGSFQKSITVFSNAENSPVKLLIKGEVQSEISNNNQ